MPDAETRGTAPPTVPVHTERAGNEATRRLLRQWLADESGYDEATWTRVKQAIEANRLSDRPRFDG
jgi:hypothetical protein